FPDPPTCTFSLSARSRHPPALHSFPTRRSSDLLLLRRAAALEEGHAAQDHRREERAGQHDAAHLLEDDGQVDEVEARATVLLGRSEEHTSELQSLAYLVCRLLLEKKNKRSTPAR